jgi:hypothetical protein
MSYRENLNSVLIAVLQLHRKDFARAVENRRSRAGQHAHSAVLGYRPNHTPPRPPNHTLQCHPSLHRLRVIMNQGMDITMGPVPDIMAGIMETSTGKKGFWEEYFRPEGHTP